MSAESSKASYGACGGRHASRADLVIKLHAGDGVSTALGGVMRGSGRQKLGSIIAGVVGYGVGLPLQAALAFSVGLGVVGLWWGAGFVSVLRAVIEVRSQSFCLEVGLL